MSPCPRVPSKAPPSLVGTAVLSRPFADRCAHLGRVPILNPVNGGLGTTRPTLIASLWPSCPQVLVYAPCPHVTVPTCPLEGSAFAGRDGCPQPSVRGQMCAPRASSYSQSGQRRVGDNPPYLKTSRRQPALPQSYPTQEQSPKNQEQRTLPLPLPLIYFPASNTALSSASLSGRFQSIKRIISPSKDSFPGCWIASRS